MAFKYLQLHPYIVVLFILCCSLSSWSSANPGDHGLVNRDKARVIFSGHSLTDPAVPVVQAIARSQNKDLISIYQSIPGSPIRVRTRGMHPSDSNPWEGYTKGVRGGINLIDELRNPSKLAPGERYDLLVITERHNILNAMEWESTISLLRHFHELLVANNPSAATYFYQSWLDINKSEPSIWIEYEKEALVAWECIANKINQSLQDKSKIRMIPTGWALAHLVEAALAGNIAGLNGSPKTILDSIFKDNVHTMPLGDLFVGAFTYSIIFGQSPEGTRPVKGVNGKSMKAILKMAWDLAQRYHQGPSPRPHTMAYCRAHVVTEICPPYWEHFFKRPSHVQACQNFYQEDGGKNPFQSSTDHLRLWPAPK